MNEMIGCKILRATIRHSPVGRRPTKFSRLPHPCYSSSSKVDHEIPNRETSYNQPISLGEALKERYFTPFKLIYRKLKRSKTDSIDSNPDKKSDQISPSIREEEKLPLPVKISDAWKLGLKGHHPSQFSRLRSQASTPILDPKLISSDTSKTSTPSFDSPDHLNGSESDVSAPPEPKKSLLQAYLDLDKRSQKIISISVFVWSLSGVIYFTWFSPFESQNLIQTHSPKSSLSLFPGSNAK